MMGLPRHMTLELTAKCNFRCPYCYCLWHEFPALGAPELDTAGWKAVLGRCAADCVEDLLFTGGEALLRPDLFQILSYARRRLPRAELSLFTNASRLDESLIRRFKRRRVRLATSLQGLATYGALTGTRRSCHRLLALLARASELGWPISVSMTIAKPNLHEAADMFAAAVLSGAASILVGPMMAGGRALAHSELMLSRAEWNATKDAIRALPNTGVPFTFSDEFFCECRNDQPAARLRRKWRDPSHTPCPAGRDFGVIGPTGQFRACLHCVGA
jgi:MoaA/NifB/PqqE/SkfB family radical SAM enzyme